VSSIARSALSGDADLFLAEFGQAAAGLRHRNIEIVELRFTAAPNAIVLAFDCGGRTTFEMRCKEPFGFEVTSWSVPNIVEMMDVRLRPTSDDVSVDPPFEMGIFCVDGVSLTIFCQAIDVSNVKPRAAA